MPAERFFVNADLIQGNTVSIEGTEYHHLAHVMRVSIGEDVELVNGKGALANARLTALSKREAILEVLAVKHIEISSPRLILAIPLMRPTKLEWVIEKCTELGVDGFWLYPAAHSDKMELSPHQLERLNHIVISAMKQCGRLDLPPLKVLKKFEELFSSNGTYLFGDTKINACPVPNTQGLVIFITGPEKGFSEKEMKTLSQKSKGVKLHSNILRAETAPIVAACLIGKVE